jgi:hypothetical protein
LSRLAFTLAAVAVLAVVALVSGPPAHTTQAAPAADVLPVAAPTTLWLAPVDLSGCAANPLARVVFPSDRPNQATGAGAIVWSASPACHGGQGARVAPLNAADEPGAAIVPRTVSGQAIAPQGEITASGAPHGEIAIAGTSPISSKGGVLIQGPANGPFAPLERCAGATTIALGTAYLGDVSLACAPVPVGRTGGNGASNNSDNGGNSGNSGTSRTSGTSGSAALSVHIERFYSHDFVRSVSVRASGGGPVQMLTLTMDFRGEALAVWVQRGAIYACLVTNTGHAHRLQRLAYVGSDTRVAALLSDDNRAIVAWQERRGPQTSVYIDRSALGVRFHKPQLLERFLEPEALASPSGSPSLVRLSSESVLIAWAGASAGRWVVRAAPVDLNGVLSVSTIAAPGGDALLADLAPGPDNEALVLWTEPLPTRTGAPDMARQAILAARGTETGDGHVVFDEPEQVAAPGPVSNATVALDPSSDHALAVWQGEAGTIEYSIRSPGAGQ